MNLTHWYIDKRLKELWHFHEGFREGRSVGWCVVGREKLDPNIMPTTTYSNPPVCMSCGVAAPKEMLDACELMGIKI